MTDQSSIMEWVDMNTYKHVFGAMCNASGLKIADYICDRKWNRAHQELIHSTGWTYSRSKSFLERYRDWDRVSGPLIASNEFIRDNYITKKPDFIKREEMTL